MSKFLPANLFIHKPVNKRKNEKQSYTLICWYEAIEFKLIRK